MPSKEPTTSTVQATDPPDERPRPKPFSIIKRGSMSAQGPASKLAAVSGVLRAKSDAGLGVAYETDEPWSDEVSDDQIRALILREALARSILKTLGHRTMGRGGPTIHCGAVLGVAEEGHVLKLAIDEFNDTHAFHSVVRQWLEQVLGRAYAPLALGLQDGLDAESEPPERVKGLDYIQVIPRNILEIKEDKNIDSPTYRQITHYKVKTSAGDKLVPAGRFIHWKNPSIEMNHQGESIFLCSYNHFRWKARMDESMAQTMRTQARAYPDLGYPPGTDDDIVTAAKEELEEFDTFSAAVHENTWVFNLKSTDKSLNPEPYYDAMLTNITLTVGGKVIALGVSGGELSTSETNERLIEGIAEDLQTNFIGPGAYRATYDRLIELGIFPEGKYWLEWPAVRTTSDMDRAEMRLKDSQAFSATMTGVEAGKRALLELGEGEGGGLVMVDPTSKIEIKVPGLNAKAPALNKAAAQYELAEEDLTFDERRELHDKLYAEWRGMTNIVRNQGTAMWNRHFDEFQASLEAEMLAAWREHMDPGEPGIHAGAGMYGINRAAQQMRESGIALTPTGASGLYVARKPATYSVDDAASFLEQLNMWNPKTSNFEADAEALVNNAYITNYGETQVLMGSMPVDPDDIPLDVQGIRKMRMTGMEYAKDTILKGKLQARLAMEDGLAGQETYRQISDRVAEALGGQPGDFKNTVQKLVHETSCEARWDSMEKMGEVKGVYITAGDSNVRDEHAALDGMVMTRFESMRYLREFGCRCDVIPQSPYQRAVANLKERGLAA